MNESLRKAVIFLGQAGIPCRAERGASGFLENVTIERGTVLFDPDRANAADLLHEAGHLAIIPEETRHLADGDLQDWLEKAGARYDELIAAGTHPDDLIMRAYMQTSDPEATAWAYAAGKAAGIPEEEIILDDHYQHEGASVRMSLEHRAYVGINGLRHAGFLNSVRDYPKLTKWLQD